MIDLVESKSRRILKTSHYSHNYTKFSVVPVGQPSRTAPSSRGRRQIKKSRNPKRDPANSLDILCFQKRNKKNPPEGGGTESTFTSATNRTT